MYTQEMLNITSVSIDGSILFTPTTFFNCLTLLMDDASNVASLNSS
jgi:hypothetical protein